MNKLINITIGIIASDDINVDSAVDIGKKIFSGLDDKKLGEISLEKKDKEKTFVTMRKSVKVGETVVQMSSDQLSQRLLASVVRHEAPLLKIFSHELSGVAPSLFHDNGERRKNNKAESMNKILTILTDVLTESAFHVIDECAWLYQIYWAKVNNFKDLCSSFQRTFLTECRTNINQITILFNGYTSESTKGPEQKRREKSCIS